MPPPFWTVFPVSLLLLSGLVSWACVVCVRKGVYINLNLCHKKVDRFHAIGCVTGGDGGREVPPGEGVACGGTLNVPD